MSKIKIYKNQSFPKSYWTNEKHHFQVGLCTEEYRQLPGHTLCMPDKPNVSKQGMTEVDKQAVLDQHNRLRGGVNPPATDLVKLVSIRSAYALYKKGLFKNLNNYFFSRTRFFLFLFYRELHFCHILFRKKRVRKWLVCILLIQIWGIIKKMYWRIKTNELWTWTVYTSNNTGSSGLFWK